MNIIRSILDTDLYKLTMQQAVLELYPNVNVTYQFNNRRKEDKFTQKMLLEITTAVVSMGYLELTAEEYTYLKEKFPFFKSWYLEYLRDFRFDPTEVKTNLVDGNLEISIAGPWHHTILWEVPLMAIISEVYFQNTTGDLDKDALLDYYNRTSDKRNRLVEAGCIFSEFGTRRRRSYSVQEMCIRAFKGSGNCAGTSNVHLARLYDMPAVGTTAHEWTMGASALCSLRHANRYALDNWVKVYRGHLGIALTDTFGTAAFFKDFDLYFAKLYDGVRHDSGNPYTFADNVVAHYKSLGVDPLSKRIIFSDGLTVDEAIKINDHCAGKIKVSFGIGTHFTNDVPGSKALNMVIKLRSVDGIEVVKISDTPTKATGDGEALAIAFKTFNL